MRTLGLLIGGRRIFKCKKKKLNLALLVVKGAYLTEPWYRSLFEYSNELSLWTPELMEMKNNLEMY